MILNTARYDLVTPHFRYSRPDYCKCVIRCFYFSAKQNRVVRVSGSLQFLSAVGFLIDGENFLRVTEGAVNEMRASGLLATAVHGLIALEATLS